MSLSLIAGCVWVFCATVVAAFPMRRQFAPGFVLLLAAPVLLGWMAWEHGVWIMALGIFAFVSMFRHPLRYILRRVCGDRPEIPS
ncbi:MAG: DUF2484 family protein [Boseongicola sp.]|nr:MAG: DUF2484 family protein [Boseongicola sp.]